MIFVVLAMGRRMPAPFAYSTRPESRSIRAPDGAERTGSSFGMSGVRSAVG
jgi:hypothetical protein